MRRPIFLTNFLRILILIPALCISAAAFAQESDVVKLINEYGTFDRWCVRQVKESGIIGGQVKYLYEFYGDRDTTICDKEPFVAPDYYLWRTNNVLAIVMGVVKTNNTVFPESRGGGYCARIETHIEKVKALGIVNMDVTCQGGIFIGTLTEPIRDTKNAMEKVLYGVEYEGRPQAVSFDYKAIVGQETIRGTGFSPLKNMGYPDYPIAKILLQKRWEEEDGSVKSLRVGTAIRKFTQNQTDWVNGFRMDIHYGDITEEPWYQDYMGLDNDPETAYHCINSKGKNVMVEEVGWATEDEVPNCLIINFLSSSGKPFYGGVGNTLWIDNVIVIE